MANNGDGGGLVLIFAVAGGLFLYSDSDWSNALWYSFKYAVAFSEVQTDQKPKDCDFIRSALGDKGCSYKAHARVYNSDGVLVDGQNAPQYGNDDKTGRPVISYDGGKNWSWYGGATLPDPKARSVRIYWAKE